VGGPVKYGISPVAGGISPVAGDISTGQTERLGSVCNTSRSLRYNFVSRTSSSRTEARSNESVIKLKYNPNGGVRIHSNPDSVDCDEEGRKGREEE
jgi:hypothetical protein